MEKLTAWVTLSAKQVLKEEREHKNRKTIIAPELKKLDEDIFSRRGGGLSKIRRMPPDRHTRLSFFILKAFE